MSECRNIWILSRDFPPKSNIAAKRFAGLAPPLERWGWRPWILALRQSSNRYGIAPGRLTVPIPESQVLRFSAEEIAPPSEVHRRLHQLLNYLRGVPGQTRFWCATSSLHYTDDFGHCYVPGLLTLCRERGFPQPDVVLSSVPPGGAILLGGRLSSALGAKWVVDFRDLQALRDVHHPLLCYLDMLWERYLLRKADGLIGVAHTCTRMLETAYKKPVATVYNGYEPAHPPAGPCVPAEPFLYYAGMLYHHQMESMELLLQSLADLRKRGLEVRVLFRILPGPAELKNGLRRRINELELENQIVLGEPTSSAHCYSEANSATANIVLEDLSTEMAYSRGTLTGKFMELIHCRPPVLAIARSDSELGAIVGESRSGWLLSTREGLTTLLAKNWPFSPREKRLQRFCREKQGRVMAEFLDSLAD